MKSLIVAAAASALLAITVAAPVQAECKPRPCGVVQAQGSLIR